MTPNGAALLCKFLILGACLELVGIYYGQSNACKLDRKFLRVLAERLRKFGANGRNLLRVVSYANHPQPASTVEYR